MTADALHTIRLRVPEATAFEHLLLALSRAIEHAALRRIVRRRALAERIVRDIDPAERRRQHVIDAYRGGVRP